MKCPLCGGKGKYKNGLGVVRRCYYCLGTGEVNDKCERVKTEQEYLQTCNTEQLAEFLCDVWYGIDEVINIMSEDGEISKKDAMKLWLKQPHAIKE